MDAQATLSQDPNAEREDCLTILRRVIFGPYGAERDDGRPPNRNCRAYEKRIRYPDLDPITTSHRVDVQSPAASSQTIIPFDQKRWANLSFKLTEEKRDSFVLEAALRKMKQNELLLTAVQHYPDHHPSTERVSPQKRSRSNRMPWKNLPFKVTSAERDEFVLEAARRRMTGKELFLAVMQFYRETHPVPRR